jgi:hypothetical protein
VLYRGVVVLEWKDRLPTFTFLEVCNIPTENLLM